MPPFTHHCTSKPCHILHGQESSHEADNTGNRRSDAEGVSSAGARSRRARTGVGGVGSTGGLAARVSVAVAVAVAAAAARVASRVGGAAAGVPVVLVDAVIRALDEPGVVGLSAVAVLLGAVGNALVGGVHLSVVGERDL